jgi:hypothetical protein
MDNIDRALERIRTMPFPQPRGPGRWEAMVRDRLITRKEMAEMMTDEMVGLPPCPKP